MQESDDPSVEGPPGCEGSPLANLLVPLFLSFSMLVFSYLLNSACLMLYFVSCTSSCKLFGCWNGDHRQPRLRPTDLRRQPWNLPGQPSKIIEFHALQSIKRHQNLYKAIRNMKIIFPNQSKGADMHGKLVFAMTLVPNAGLNSACKRAWKTHMLKS